MSTETKYPSSNPDIWGGIECTINRVGNVFRDQLYETGHYGRGNDIDAFARLGIKKMRYPVLWEKHLPDESGKIDWRQTKTRLEELRSNKITPIAGLLHHGSGPAYTNLMDDAFADKLAAYAGQVAEQFPWLEYYTPVNEPLTTARFSGLYGVWYPHQTRERSFIQMLLNQVKGIILSMQAIRKTNPAAKLIQTEDLCKVHSTPALAYQAEFENERRWLTYDLLCGRFNAGHPFWAYFLSLGIPEKDLSFFAGNTCPPWIMGFNYYLTSERYLDDNLDNYPPHLIGGNGRHRYADTDAARTNKRSGLAVLLQEAWERYRLPMAVTECHLNCTREEQMRWLKEIWDACCLLNRNGIPVKAVTAWSLLGSFDWDSLLQRKNGHYESGVFDISAGYLRPTLLAQMIRAFAQGQTFDHPLLNGKGWWQDTVTTAAGSRAIHPLLITGFDAGTTGNFEQVCRERQIGYQLFSFDELPTGSNKPWGVILTVSDWQLPTTAVYETVSTYCRRQQIPLLVTASSNGCTYEESHLLVYNEGTESMKFAHQAMDLFIDGENGNWHMGKNGVRKNECKEPALLY